MQAEPLLYCLPVELPLSVWIRVVSWKTSETEQHLPMPFQTLQPRIQEIQWNVIWLISYTSLMPTKVCIDTVCEFKCSSCSWSFIRPKRRLDAVNKFKKKPRKQLSYYLCIDCYLNSIQSRWKYVHCSEHPHQHNNSSSVCYL